MFTLSGAVPTALHRWIHIGRGMSTVSYDMPNAGEAGRPGGKAAALHKVRH